MIAKIYIQQSIWDCLIELCIGMALSYSLLSCFYVDPQIQYGPVPGAIVAICMISLFMISINKHILRIGIPIYAVALVMSWICAAALSDGTAFADVETNAMIYVMVSTLCSTGVFLLCRTHIGSSLLFIAGVVILALIQFLYERYDIGWLLAFVVSSIAVIIYKNFLLSVRSADSVRSANFPAGFFVATVVSVVSVGIGGAVWFGVIAPLSPDALQIKLISETRSLEMVLAKGVSSDYLTPDTSLTSDMTGEESRTTDDVKEDPNGTPTPANGSDTSAQVRNPNNAGSFFGENIDSPDDLFDLANYDLRTYILLALAIALVVGIIMYFVFRRQNRTYKLMWMRSLGTSQEAKSLYATILAKFSKLGIKPSPGQTLNDFAIANEEHLHYFNEASNESFHDITEMYARSIYGAKPFCMHDLFKMERFYSSFWKGAFKQLGPVRYFFKSFRL